jgi:hypothetical protein
MFSTGYLIGDNSPLANGAEPQKSESVMLGIAGFKGAGSSQYGMNGASDAKFMAGQALRRTFRTTAMPTNMATPTGSAAGRGTTRVS